MDLLEKMGPERRGGGTVLVFICVLWEIFDEYDSDDDDYESFDECFDCLCEWCG